MNALVEQLKSTVTDTKATDIRAAFAGDPKRFSTLQRDARRSCCSTIRRCAVNDKVLDGLEKLAKAKAGRGKARRDVCRR